MVETRWKFLHEVDGRFRSEHGNMSWHVNHWVRVDGDMELCANGFHCSRRLSEAFSYVQGELVAKVLVRGDSDVSSDKEAWREMKLVDVRRWSKMDSVALAV